MRPEEGDPVLADIGRVFHALPERDREILALAGWERLDAARIGVVLG